MDTEYSKALVRRYVEQIFNGKDLALVSQIASDGYLDHVALHGQVRSIDDLKRNLTIFHTAFPDGVVTADDIVAEGDRVVWRWTHNATHLGPFAGVAPTGRQVVWSGIIIWRIDNGKVVEWWANTDILGLLQQLGAQVIVP